MSHPGRDRPSRGAPYPNRNPRRPEAQQNVLSQSQEQNNHFESLQRAWQASCLTPFPPAMVPYNMIPLHEELNLQLAYRLALGSWASEHTNPYLSLPTPGNAIGIRDEPQLPHLPGPSLGSWETSHQNPFPPNPYAAPLAINLPARQLGQDVEDRHRHAPNNERQARPAHEEQPRSVHQQHSLQSNEDSRRNSLSPFRRSDPSQLVPLPALQDFIRLNRGQVWEIITRNDLNASGEDIYWHLMIWTEASNNRRKVLPNFLLEVRLIFLPIEFLRETVRMHILIDEDATCQGYVRDAMDYRCLFAADRYKLRKKQIFPASWGPTNSKVFERQYCTPRNSIEPHKRIYLFGGNRPLSVGTPPATMMTFEFFDCEYDRWTHAGNMPTSRILFGAAAFQDNIWIVGGYCDGKGERDIETGLVGTVHIYHPALSVWSIGPRLIKKRLNLGLIGYKGSLYAIGGKSETQDAEKSVEVVQAAESMSWEGGVEMNLARAGMGVVVLRSQIYVVGGVRSEDRNQMESFSSVTKQWTLVPNIYIARRDYSAIGVDDELMYIFADNCRTRIVYNPACTTHTGWRRLEVDTRCLKDEFAVAAVDGYVYIIGGYSINGRMDSVSAYNPAHHRWIKHHASCTSCRAGAKAVVVNKRWT